MSRLRKVSLLSCGIVLLVCTLMQFAPSKVMAPWTMPVISQTGSPNASRGSVSVKHPPDPTTTEHNTTAASQQGQGAPNNGSESGPGVKVIILSYMRSGSSLTGELFNQHPETFYFYEPFWTINKDFIFNKDSAFFFHRKTMKSNPSPVRYLKQNVMNHSLQCDFEQVYLGALESPVNLNSQAFQPFAQCHERNPGTLGLHACLPLLRHACLAAKVSESPVNQNSQAFQPFAQCHEKNPRTSTSACLSYAT